jgi:hypothetical protein
MNIETKREHLRKYTDRALGAIRTSAERRPVCNDEGCTIPLLFEGITDEGLEGVMVVLTRFSHDIAPASRLANHLALILIHCAREQTARKDLTVLSEPIITEGNHAN